MIGPTIDLVNKAWRESMAYKKSHKAKTFKCPYPHMSYKTSTGKYEKVYEDCKYGPGNWCALCYRHTKHQRQLSQSKEVYLRKKKHYLDSYKKTGLVPHLRKDFYSSKRRY